LQGQCTIAQKIDQEFWKGVHGREQRRIEEEKAERLERQERKKNGENLAESE
jgi:hypothetical protein